MWVSLKRASCCVCVFGSVNYACVPQVFQQLINTSLCPAFRRKFVCQPLCCVPLQIQTFYKNLVLIAEYHVHCWQILQCRLLWWISGATNWSQKLIRKKNSEIENFICNQYGERLAILNTENITICLHFLPYLLNIYKNDFLISQDSVATWIRWGR